MARSELLNYKHLNPHAVNHIVIRHKGLIVKALQTLLESEPIYAHRGVCGHLLDLLSPNLSRADALDCAHVFIQQATGTLWPVNTTLKEYLWEGEQRKARMTLIQDLIDLLNKTPSV